MLKKRKIENHIGLDGHECEHYEFFLFFFGFEWTTGLNVLRNTKWHLEQVLHSYNSAVFKGDHYVTWKLDVHQESTLFSGRDAIASLLDYVFASFCSPASNEHLLLFKAVLQLGITRRSVVDVYTNSDCFTCISYMELEQTWINNKSLQNISGWST